ncbi:MAG: TonB-dependent receptor, partial [Pirellulales bacterium]|nr:TonB-dependent receptor [Pirellulales bacterium]
LFGAWACSGAAARGQTVQPAPLPGASKLDAVPADNPSDAADAATNILDMDIESLAKVDVLTSTMTDPVVEAVSKTPEKASEAPGIVDVITHEDIEEFGAKNLYEALQWATSVHMSGSFLQRRNMASIRGNLIKHEDNHVLVLINGRPFRDSTLGGVNISIYTAFPIQTIERIEVIRGPGSVLYGTNAFTGVINVVTKDPKEPTFHASVLSGSYGWQSYSLAGGNGNENRGFYAGTTYSRAKGWPFTATLEDPPGPLPALKDSCLYGEDNVGLFTMYRNGGFTANMFLANAREETISPTLTWFPGQMHTPRAFVDLGYRHDIDEQQNVAVNFTYNYDGTDFPSALSTPGSLVYFISPSHGFLLEATYRAALTQKLDWMVGALTDIHHGVASMRFFQPIPEYNEVWYGVYTQFDYRVTERLKFVGGMQGNMPGEVRGGIVPRAGVIASLGDHWTTKFLYGQSFRSPYRLERTMNIPGLLEGNPNLIPETMQTFDYQIAYHTDDYRLAATYFHSDFFDLVSRVGVPQTYVNYGTIRFQGVELENEWKISDRLRWLCSVTYQDNVRDDNHMHNTTLAPNWMAKMGASYRTPGGWTVSLFDSFYGKPAANPEALVVNPVPQAYHLMSLNATLDLDRAFHWHTGRSMKLQFLVQNLLNERIDHPEFEREVINSLPAEPGRTYYGGFSMAF